MSRKRRHKRPVDEMEDPGETTTEIQRACISGEINNEDQPLNNHYISQVSGRKRSLEQTLCCLISLFNHLNSFPSDGGAEFC